MNQKLKDNPLDMKALLSALWIFILFNMLFRDMHELARPGFLEEILSNSANGTSASDGLLLAAGLLLQIPIGMVVLSRVLPLRTNRWANIMAGVVVGAFVIGAGTNDLDDILFVAIEILALLLIIGLAWRWPRREVKLAPSPALDRPQ